MKSLRVWLLAVLAFVLPFRDAMAAALLCTPGSLHSHGTVVTAVDDAPAVAAHLHMHGMPGPASAGMHAGASHGAGPLDGHPDGTGTCSFCASCCWAASAVPLAFTLPQAPPAPVTLPEVLAPDAEFLSAGQDRPPRSI